MLGARVGRAAQKGVLTEGNEDNEELQPGENTIFVSFVIFCLESSVRFLPYFWFCPVRAARRSLGVGGPWLLGLRCNALTIQRGEANSPRNLALISVLYSGERPEITPHDEESKAKTRNSNRNKQ
jgi:hypothetical protein